MGQLNECLQSILADANIGTGPDEEGRVRLRERVDGGKGPKEMMEVLLSSVSAATTVVHLGRKPGQHAIPKKARASDWNKICDFVLFEDCEERCRVVLVELKRTLQKRLEGLEQLRRTLPLAKYLIAVCEVQLQRSWRCEFSYLLVAQTRTNRLDKQPVHARSEPLKTMRHRGIDVSISIGARFDVSELEFGS